MLTKEEARIVRNNCLTNLTIISGRAGSGLSAKEIEDAYFMLREWICNTTDALTVPEPPQLCREPGPSFNPSLREGCTVHVPGFGDL